MKHPEAGKPRGLLKASVPAGQFHHARRLASENLRPFVAHYWIVRWDLQGHQPQIREVLPHPSVHLLLEQGRSCIAGVSTGKFIRVIEGRGQVFGISFDPAASTHLQNYPFPISQTAPSLLAASLVPKARHWKRWYCHSKAMTR